MVRIVAFPIEHCDVKLIFGMCGQTTLPPAKCILLDMVFIVFFMRFHIIHTAMTYGGWLRNPPPWLKPT